MKITTLQTLIVTTLSAAAQSSSIDYEITHHSIGAGHQVEQLSMDYQIEASATSASVTGVGTAMLDQRNLVLRAGVAGLVFQATTNAFFSAASPGVDEDKTMQLLAEFSNDDDTFSPMPPGSVFWSGPPPLGFINHNDVANFTPIATNTTLTVTADFQGSLRMFSFTVVDSDKDNYDLYAGDQLPDNWQINSFPPFSVLIRPADDFDNDGISNLGEYLRGTNPATNDLPFFAFSRTNRNSTNYLTLRYRERKNPFRWRIAVTASPILAPMAPWTELGVTTTTISDHGTYLLKEASIPTTGTREFLRLEPFTQP